ncbi:trypsin-like peptidase domain-containing protein [Cognatishimia sp. F0-27]|uniref:trypsin-like peptidase domain-containing protein n=1 Tax=Cognatishimia sp. F0-27 TaxID=2816855 RepID=UPI001D0C910B|nr:trypsin-like peptidase domain-containing protein [Cognatishimia sp. F0-27]MCC1495000.1 peptidoglycan-binding protein [Cognatishimia sp. F0-27]
MKSVLLATVAALSISASGAFAQEDRVYIQIEARSSLAGAEARVRAWSGQFEDVAGFALGGGWYGVALGPYTRAQAQALLPDLRRRGAIPSDSFIEDQSEYGQQFWPVGGARDLATVPETPVEDAPAVVVEAPAPDPVAPDIPDETPREARASEALLDRTAREELQIALQWAGFYSAAIDGAFGRGTRGAMRSWQDANGFEPTGILTTRQRAVLLQNYYAILEGMDMRRYSDARVGLSLELPLGVVAFDRFEAPFALFAPTTDLEARVLLISQPGDRQTMNGLYEIMQTLEIVPLDGARERRSDGFVLTGANDRIVSHTEVTLRDGAIKGFTLIWPAGDEERRSRVLGLMQASVERIDGVLDPAAISDDGQQIDLVSGLKVRTPKVAASGFFIDRSGAVLTTLSTVDACARVTLDGVHDAEVVARDADLGVALLRPVERLAPRGVAGFSDSNPRLQSEVAVAGYSFGGVLGAPTLTFGTLEDLRGLGGEQTLKRLALSSMPGDAGGPVFDMGGGVSGMLLPREEGGNRRLPEGVSFAAKSGELTRFLQAAGVTPEPNGNASGVMAPEDLTALAANMTVLVSCWE